MRALLQKVSSASVAIEKQLISKIGPGLLVFLGAEEGDTEEDTNYIAKKISQIRIFPDKHDKLNLDIRDVKGEILLVSQFTLVADCKKGNRPSFSQALSPAKAEMFYNNLVQRLKSLNLDVKTGKFKAQMKIKLVNDGPVTIFIDSRKRL